MAEPASEKPITVYAAIAANLLIALSKFVVAGITGSSAMLSEGIHSLADTGNQGLLLLGIHLSRRPADDTHPFGHGKELYFWSLIVAIVLFGVGGGISLYEGILHLHEPAELGDPMWNYIVLALAALFESTAFVIALRELRETAAGESLWRALHRSKDPKIFVVLFEDSAALAGLLVAFLGVYFGHRLEMPSLDAIASLVIAAILMAVALVLAFESRQLLLGEAADPKLLASLEKIVAQDRDVLQALKPVTMHMGPDEILLNMELTFRKELSSAQIVAAIDRVEEAIRAEHPQVKRIYLEAEALRSPRE